MPLHALRSTGCLAFLILLLGIGLPAAASATSSDDAVNALADELLAHMQATSAYVRLQSGLTITDFDPINLEHERSEAKFNAQMLVQLNAIKLDELNHDQWLLAKTLHHSFESGAHAEDNYWFTFAVTPYAGGQALSTVHAILAVQPLASDEERDNYLRLLDSYAVMLEQIAAKTRAQAQRGIRVANPAIPGVLAMFHGFQASAPATFVPAESRLSGIANDRVAGFKEAVNARLQSQITPGYAAILNVFDADYTKAAPAEVGISRLPGGSKQYLRLISDYVDPALTPRQIHRIGEQRVQELERRMTEIRERVKFQGSSDSFNTMLHTDPRFIAKSPGELEKHYLDYVARVEPFVPVYFSTLPKAPYGVRRLALAAEAGMTYGYYEMPTPSVAKGFYNYNGSDLDKRSLVAAEHLIFHELVPGHHFQLALQVEKPNQHPVRKFLLDAAFVEGWAEYAAGLCEQMGLYSDPYSLYGHLLMQSFIASRLVVDTGMNYFNMPLVEARKYLKAHTFEADPQIASETLRYSTDIFAQALGYRLGYERFLTLRGRAERALGARFDIREFHAAAMGQGSMPLEVLDQQIDWYIAQRSH
jgi:uncharacterized protein (DUF885 family)